MCGIAGAVALRDALPDPERSARMACLMAHRGPDGDGLWVAPSRRAVLAHRRLSIIDLATGQQPMSTPDGRWTISFNGEIYNYRELRAELERAGETLRTGSDTEVLLLLYAREGEACLQRLRGMFAFAVWDERDGELFVARDRTGEKPLYHAVAGGVLHFASTLAALRDAVGGSPRLSAMAMDAFLTLGYIPAPLTAYEGIAKLPAGHVLRVRGGEVRTSRYHDFATLPDEPAPTSARDAEDQADALVREAVTLQLRSDVPLGIFLSGGVDSSLVAAIARQVSAGTVRTFSIGFGEAGFDESAHAEAVARHLGTEHLTFRARPDLLGLLPELVRHFGEPFGDSTALATWMLAERSRPHVTVALGGDGGDEGFAGYAWYRNALRLEEHARRVPAPLARVGAGLVGVAAARTRAGGRLRRGLSALAAPDDASRFARLRSFVDADLAASLYAPAMREVHRTSVAGAERVRQAYLHAEGTPLRRMRVADIATYLADGLLPKVDVSTMAHGLETRAPLLDHKLLGFALSLPDGLLVGPGGGKALLRRVLARYVPPELTERPKQGFDVPVSEWATGAQRERVTALPRSERLLDTGWFRAEGLRQVVDEHLAGGRDHGQRLYELLVLDEWLQRT